VIELRGLAKRYGAREVVQDLDLDIPAGQLVGLLGPNGAGKSTLIKMLTGIVAPTRGTARVGAFDVATQPLEAKRILGYVPESGGLFETLTCQEYLDLVAVLHGIDKAEADARIERMLSFFDLGDEVRRQQLGSFSKGMRQKVLISAALLHNPQVVLFDEPLNGLDANAALMFKTLVTNLAHEGKTIVYCSHILDVVERMCPRIVILHQGRILSDGSATEIRARVGADSLEQAFNRMTGSENMLQRAEDLARVLGQ